MGRDDREGGMNKEEGIWMKEDKEGHNRQEKKEYGWRKERKGI